MIDPVALEKAAIALANQTVMRNGSPPISNVLDLMSAQTRSSFTGDATACIEAYLEAAKPAAGWMPISEAPRLRSVDLLLANAHTGEVAQGYWDTYATSLTAGAGFFDYSGEVFTPWAKQPTHFMPLPAAPEPTP